RPVTPSEASEFMFLHRAPSLAAVPDLTPVQLERLTASVEQRRQKLEGDIQAYIKQKQADLEQYESELLEECHSMDRAAPAVRQAAEEPRSHPPPAVSDNPPVSPIASPDAESIEAKKLGPPETAKRTKHTRVQKREQELCGLVTPIFLPLLDARGISPPKKKKEKRRHREESAVAGDPTPEHAGKEAESGRSRSRNRAEQMDRKDSVAVGGESGSRQKEESGKKSRRVTTKKSALRHEKTPRNRRKRVSLVIDDQIVLPADNIIDATPIVSPSETSASTTSTSTASLDDMIDPQLLERNEPPAHQDPVHHSLPSQRPMHHYDSHHGPLYTNFSNEPISRSLPVPMSIPTVSPTRQPSQYISTVPLTLDLETPQPAARTFLDPPPNQELNIPAYASPAPIYANEPELADAPEEQYTALVRSEADAFDTYVGGPSGSGVDDVNQAGSYGYPSSLGASYMESYMKNRPLSVRIAAAEKAELEEHEKTALIAGESEGDERMRRADFDRGIDDIDEGMEIIGDMEGF
ncbi:hypothetical protein P154DRAFT_432881, partial [Amniculicola lignicola CBS 123094]